MMLQFVPASDCAQVCKRSLLKREPIDVYRDKFKSYWSHNNKSRAKGNISKIEQYMRSVPCGLMNFDPATLIVGGKRVPYSAWPWHVLPCKNQLCCGGTLISPDMVVTAAHCVNNVLNIVRTGVNNRYDTDQSREQVRNIARGIKHADYNPAVGNDVGLLHLDRPVNITGDFVRPVCLPYVDIIDMHYCYLIGSGETKDQLTNQYKKQMRVKYVPLNICQLLSRIMNFKIDERSLCFVGLNENDATCHGDSGGGVHCIHNGKWHLVGVVSKARSGCDPRFPTIFMSVHWFLEWILEAALDMIDRALLS